MIRFRHIENDGGPTHWNVEPFEHARRSFSWRLPSGLLGVIADERYALDSPGTFWHADLQSFLVSGADVELSLKGRWEDRIFNFRYRDIKLFETTMTTLHFPPSVIIQELTPLRGRFLDHVWSDLGGDRYRFVCRSIEFREDLLV